MPNSQSVANENYLRVTDEHFERAAKAPTGALQNPVQSAAATARNDQQAAPPISEFAEEFDGVRSDATQIVLPVGLEPTNARPCAASNLGQPHVSRAAESGADLRPTLAHEAEQLLRLWANTPMHLRGALLEILEHLR
ncbi:MAG: hypothetical protein AB7O59_15270 [Pirellulales bacterium]